MLRYLIHLPFFFSISTFHPSSSSSSSASSSLSSLSSSSSSLSSSTSSSSSLLFLPIPSPSPYPSSSPSSLIQGYDEPSFLFMDLFEAFNSLSNTNTNKNKNNMKNNKNAYDGGDDTYDGGDVMSVMISYDFLLTFQLCELWKESLITETQRIDNHNNNENNEIYITH